MGTWGRGDAGTWGRGDVGTLSHCPAGFLCVSEPGGAGVGFSSGRKGREGRAGEHTRLAGAGSSRHGVLHRDPRVGASGGGSSGGLWLQKGWEAGSLCRRQSELLDPKIRALTWELSVVSTWPATVGLLRTSRQDVPKRAREPNKTGGQRASLSGPC